VPGRDRGMCLHQLRCLRPRSDLGTGAERLLTKLDDDVRRWDVIDGLSVSADRRWIAFSSKTFRVTSADLAALTGPIYSVSVDGRRFVRLTPPLPPAGSGRTCTVDAQCNGGERCDSVACFLGSYSRTLSNPAWSPDGKGVYFALGESWIDRDGTLSGGVRFGVVRQSEVWLELDLRPSPARSG